MKLGQSFLLAELAAEVAMQMADNRNQSRAEFRTMCLNIAQDIRICEGVEPHDPDLHEVVEAYLWERDLHKRQYYPGYHAA